MQLTEGGRRALNLESHPSGALVPHHSWFQILAWLYIELILQA